MSVTVGILTISDRASAGTYDDRSGPILKKMVENRLAWPVSHEGVIPDNLDTIKGELIRWADDLNVNLILTTGGTGFSPRDVTPEATTAVIERDVPGMAEAMRRASLSVTPHAMLSRGVCGIRDQSLIVNLPGSPKAARENLDVILPVLPHALELLLDDPGSEAGHQFA